MKDLELLQSFAGDKSNDTGRCIYMYKRGINELQISALWA